MSQDKRLNVHAASQTSSLEPTKTLAELALDAQTPDAHGDRFTLENHRLLRVDLQGAPASAPMLPSAHEDATSAHEDVTSAHETATSDSAPIDGADPEAASSEDTQPRDESSQVASSAEYFESPNESQSEANCSELWIKTGAMVAYVGNIEFTREGWLEKGFGRMLKKAVTGEATPLTRASGCGQLYLADAGKRIQVLRLDDESLFVRGSALMAMETGVEWDIGFVPKLSAVAASGLFNVELKGPGRIAISSHFQPIVLSVTPDRPVVTDPDATIAWSGSLSPEYRAALTFQTFLGRGSGEAVQMEFCGTGFVIVQPFEESALHP